MNDQRQSGSGVAVVVAVVIVLGLVLCGGVVLVGAALFVSTTTPVAPLPVMQPAPLPVEKSQSTPNVLIKLDVDSAGDLRLSDEPVSQEELPNKLATLQSSFPNLHLQLRIANDAPNSEKRREELTELLRNLNVQYTVAE